MRAGIARPEVTKETSPVTGYPPNAALDGPFGFNKIAGGDTLLLPKQVPNRLFHDLSADLGD